MSGARSQRDETGMWSRASTVVLGLLLIGAGIVLLAVNVFGATIPIDVDQVGWPVFVIVPGLLVLVVGLLANGEGGMGMTVAGGIVTAVGLILAYQVATDHWSSWAYAWALVAPGAVGASMLLWGLLHRRGAIVRQGLSALGVGLVIFIVGFAFFEGVLNISGSRGLAPLGRQALPVALIVAGALVIVSRLWPRSRREPIPQTDLGSAPTSNPTVYGAPVTPATDAPPPTPDPVTPPVQAAPQAPPWASSSSSQSTPPVRSTVDEETTA